MTRATWIRLAAVFGLLLVPLAQGGPSAPVGSFSASSVEDAGAGQIHGEFLALTQLDRVEDETQSDFRLSAEKIAVDLDTYRSKAAVADLLAPDGQIEQTHDTYSMAEASGLDAQASHQFYLLAWDGRPLPTVTVHGSQGYLTASDTDRVEAKALFPSIRSEGPSVDTRTADRWVQSNPEATLCVEGSFIMSLWFWDLRVSDARGSTVYLSGERQTPVDEPTGALAPLQEVVYAANRTQTWLFVEGGRFCSSWPSTSESVLYIANERLDTAGPVILREVFGEINTEGESQGLDGRVLQLTGQMSLYAPSSTEPGLHIMLDGTVASAKIDGSDATWMFAASSQGFPVPSWLPFAGFGLLVPAAAGGELVRRHRLRNQMKSLSDRMNEGDYESVASRADRLIRTRAYGQDASVMKALSLIQLGRISDARQFLEGLGPWSGPQAATQYYLRAYVHALEGDKSVAIDELGQCLRVSPDYQEEVLANPTFTPMLSDPSLRRLLGLEAAHAETAGVDRPDVEGYA